MTHTFFESRFWLKCSLLIVALLGIERAGTTWATDPKLYAVQASATVTASPPQIRLAWPADANATSYRISRKLPEATAWNPIATLPGNATSYTDTQVAAGTAYEYQLSKATQPGYQGTGYLLAGIEAPLIENRGKIVLLVDSTIASDLEVELARLESDLVGDGWSVLRHEIAPSTKVTDAKNLIKADYAADPQQVRAVFLLGHIPVPYSGDVDPDAHGDHQGAWPADAFYGDMDGTWTDATVNDRSASDSRNWNVPGDGKFDQSDLPSLVELAVGRVDFSALPNFANKQPGRSEIDLLRQYLNKDHNFRRQRFVVERRALISDNFGEKEGEAFAADGWRNFSALFGASRVRSVGAGSYFSSVSTASYLWSYACGGGSYFTCEGVGTSDDFATSNPQVVFTIFFGSYFGDWDNPKNFLRSSLGSLTHTLAVCWAGRPHWFLHPMGLGETIGAATRLTQNNGRTGTYAPQGWYPGRAYISLLGDPTLRLHPVGPPVDVAVGVSGGTASVSWSASADAVLGYHVYRATSPSGPFQRLTPTLITDTHFSESVSPGSSTYMVRAVKLEQSSSGTYFNPSQGVMASISVNGSDAHIIDGRPAAPDHLAGFPKSLSEIELAWNDRSDNETEFSIERRKNTTGSYLEIGIQPANATRFLDTGLQPGNTYYYRIASRNIAGDSAHSNEIAVDTAVPMSVAAEARFISSNSTAKGNWKNNFGRDGFHIAGDGVRKPIYGTVGFSGETTHFWNPATDDIRALQQAEPASGRLASTWYGQTLALDVSSLDRGEHLLSLYLLDWDAKGRSEKIELIDLNTSTVLDQRTVSDFSAGVYLTWQIQGRIELRFTTLTGPNAVVSGLFFDPVASASPVLSARRSEAGTWELHLEGEPGQTGSIETSSDLLHWFLWHRASLIDYSRDIEDPQRDELQFRFYRLVQ